jgi:hypothetical protein
MPHRAGGSTCREPARRLRDLSLQRRRHARLGLLPDQYGALEADRIESARFVGLPGQHRLCIPALSGEGFPAVEYVQQRSLSQIYGRRPRWGRPIELELTGGVTGRTGHCISSDPANAANATHLGLRRVASDLRSSSEPETEATAVEQSRSRTPIEIRCYSHFDSKTKAAESIPPNLQTAIVRSRWASWAWEALSGVVVEIATVGPLAAVYLADRIDDSWKPTLRDKSQLACKLTSRKRPVYHRVRLGSAISWRISS